MFSILLYNIFLYTYSLGIHIASLKSIKARQWINGRKNWQHHLNNFKRQLISEKNNDQPKILWMHCASLGEFEQGRPVLEQLKSQIHSLRVVVTFFSPSGYEVRKSYDKADLIFYLPIDNKKNAKDFISILQPSLVLWVKYEFWYYYLKEIHNKNIPLLLVSGIFRKDQPFFKWYGRLHKQMLQCFTCIFVQNESSAALVSKITSRPIIPSGDTRFDRVVQMAQQPFNNALVEKWLNKTAEVIVAGSTWDEDHEVLAHYIKLHSDIKWIIAPHNIDKDQIGETLKFFPNALLYSKFNEYEFRESNILIIDNIGLLAMLYRYATITYIGGGFGSDGIHNILEAAVYSKPVIHGPEFEKFAEAEALVELGGAFEIEDALELEKVLDKLFSNNNFYADTSRIAGKFVYKNTGATKKVLDYIDENRLLTN